MNKNCGIYKITSPTGKIYIGQSINIANRWKEHKRMRSSLKSKLQNSFKKYGVENHQFDIIEYCSEEQLNCSERFWQDEFNVINKNGLNCVLQESVSKRRVVSEELKMRISKTNTGKKMSVESRLKLSTSKKGILKSKETKKRMSLRQMGELNHFYGKTFTEEHKNKISKGNRGNKHTEKTKQKMSISKTGENNVTSKILLNTQTGIYYYSIREAAEAHNINYSTFRVQLCQNRNPTYLIVT